MLDRLIAVGGVRPLSSIRRAARIADVDEIFDDEVNVVLLARAMEEALKAEAANALAQPGLSIMTTVAPGSGRGALRERLPQMPTLADDIHAWAEMLATITGCTVVGIRLARLTAAMCPRFHVDNVTIRVVSTLFGSGTELVALEEEAVRAAARAPRPHARVERAGQGELVILKGEQWPGNRGRGALHRSPRASADRPRLVMTLDSLS